MDAVLLQVLALTSGGSVEGKSHGEMAETLDPDRSRVEQYCDEKMACPPRGLCTRQHSSAEALVIRRPPRHWRQPTSHLTQMKMGDSFTDGEAL
jgi:hypothetical protein